VTVDDVRLDAELVAAIVRDQFPQLQAATVAYLGEGYDSTAFDIDPRVVPFDTWAPVLAQFLSWLHRVRLDEAEKLGVEREDVVELIDEARTDALVNFDSVKRVAPDSPLETWHSYVAAAPVASGRSSSPPVMAHRDLGAEHLLYDAKTLTLTGVIDWSEIAIDDRSWISQRYFTGAGVRWWTPCSKPMMGRWTKRCSSARATWGHAAASATSPWPRHEATGVHRRGAARTRALYQRALGERVTVSSQHFRGD
jgi:hypothetical protein